MKPTSFIQRAVLIAALPLSLSAAPIPFETPTTQDAGVSPRGLAVGSLLGNGSQQLAVANFGSGTFIGQSTPASQLNARNSSVQIFGLTGSNLDVIATLRTASGPRGMAIFDADASGKGVLFVSAYDAGLLQAFQWEHGSFQKLDEAPTLKMPVGVAAGTVRRGGTPFVAVADYGADQVSIYSFSNGKLAKKADVPVPGGPVQLAVGDLSGNGSDQIAVVCMSANKVVILAASSEDPSTFAVSKQLDLPPGGSPSDLRLADLNGDGRADLVLADFSKNDVQIFLQQADGSLTAQTPLSTSGQHPNGLTVDDLDGDGTPEILVANRDSDTMDVFASLNGTYGLSQTLALDSGSSNHGFGPVEVAMVKTSGTHHALVTTHMRSNSLRVIPLVVVAPTPTAGPSGHGSTHVFSGETTYFYPNPAHGPSVKLHFDLPAPSDVNVQVFDLTGTLVWSATLSASQTNAGENNVDWNLTNKGGQPLASGSYIGRFTVGGVSFSKKLAVIH